MPNLPRHSLSSIWPRLLAPRSQAERVVLAYGLHAQRRFFAYMVGFTGIGIPMFLWAASFSIRGWPYFAYAGMIIFNALVFLWLAGKSKLKDEPCESDMASPRLEEALWRQGFGAGLWAVGLLVICLSAAKIGHRPELLLMTCAGAAVGIIFFSSPVQTLLLILGPVAMAGPIIAMRSVAQDSEVSHLINAGLTLALAMGFVINRHLREYYQLRHRQAQLQLERERAQKTTDILHQSRAALLDTLSRDVQSGLSLLEASLGRSMTYLNRAPAPRNEVNSALGEAQRLKYLISSTLDNGTLEAGTLEVNCSPLDLRHILDESAAHFAPLAQARGLTLCLDHKALPDTGAALGDSLRVQQIIGHLLKNAIDYSVRGNIDVRVDPVRDHLRLSVIDTGSGLNAEELKHAFLPYQRIMRTCGGQGGAGLGLSLSKALAELMGGQLGAESTRDVGSKFWLDLRFDPAAKPPKPQLPCTVPASEPFTQRVLLLSNDSLRAAQLRSWLEAQGHLCLLSTKVERARTLVQKSAFDALVISHDASEEVRELIGNIQSANFECKTRIVALLNSAEHSQALMDKGVQTLIWPISQTALERAIKSVH